MMSSRRSKKRTRNSSPCCCCWFGWVNTLSLESCSLFWTSPSQWALPNKYFMKEYSNRIIWDVIFQIFYERKIRIVE
jgi:hypothetical protein